MFVTALAGACVTAMTWGVVYLAARMDRRGEAYWQAVHVREVALVKAFEALALATLPAPGSAADDREGGEVSRPLRAA